MKLGLICDSHMPYNSESAQWQFCTRAAAQFKEDNISDVITLGDITSFGEPDALCAYFDMFASFNHYSVLGNSDARDKATAGVLCEKCPGFEFYIGNRKCLGINTAYAKINEADKKRLEQLNDGDIVVMHHPVERLFDENCRAFMLQLCEQKALTILCAHLHRKLSGMIGKSKYFGIRAIDPDKSFGDWPCVTYFDSDTDEISEVLLKLPKETLWSVREKFGISCVDNHRDVAYAAANKVYGVELRCNGKGWEPDFTLLPVIEEWRKAGGEYLSVHMPNLYWRDGGLSDTEVWKKAVEYAVAVDANGLTIHPPRVKLKDLSEGHDKLLEQYIYVVENVPEAVNIGIENLHMSKGEDPEDRAFGYIPSEVASWIDELNAATKRKNPIGHTLDVGHARNNGALASRYPISRWYELVGKRTVAYHIHQVIQKEEGLKNHNPIEAWFGPQISYVSFFHNWESGLINQVPVFLEVKGAENYEKSIQAFNRAFK